MRQKGKWRYASSQREMEICKQKGKWRYASSTLWYQGEMDKCKQQSEIKMSHLPVISIYGCVGGRQI